MTRRKVSAPSPAAAAARQRAASAVNSELTMLYWRIVQWIPRPACRQTEYPDTLKQATLSALLSRLGINPQNLTSIESDTSILRSLL